MINTKTNIYPKNTHDMKLLIKIIAILCFPLLMNAQEKLEVGLIVGGANYQGDVASKSVFSFKQTQFAGGFFLRGHLSNKISLRGNMYFTRLKGDDLNFVDEGSWREDRAFNFTSPVSEFSLTPEWHLFGNRTKRHKLRPYLFGGLGLVITDPVTNLDTSIDPATNLPIHLETQEGHFSTTNLLIPIGAGVALDLTDKLSLGLEFSSRFPVSDYLDGISESANPDKKDWYSTGGLTLAYKIGESIPKIVDTDGDGVSDDRDSCPLIAGKVKGCPDTDEDGIADRMDDCPDVFGERRFAGCPDTDSDGIVDSDDKCPTMHGTLALNGCPDMDADGIADMDDKCPDVAGSLASNGCPDDRDGDGVADARDGCPDVKGTIYGCPDRDEDGVADINDKCPTMKGLLTLGGCPDTDSDGIADADDNCPTQPGVAGNRGCPEVILASKGTSRPAVQYLVEEIYFNTTRAKIPDDEIFKLDQVASIMLSNPEYMLQINGHTDDAGDSEVNEHLSMRRARRCFKYLAAKGIPLYRMSFEGYGDAQPKYDGKELNRRVEFAFVGR